MTKKIKKQKRRSTEAASLFVSDSPFKPKKHKKKAGKASYVRHSKHKGTTDGS